MKVFSIDPGNIESAWLLLGDDGRPMEFGKEPNQKVLDRVMAGSQEDLFVVEMIASYGMPVGREVFDTAMWSGRFIQAHINFNAAPIIPVFRKDIKLHFCGSPKANDATIRQALIDRYGPGRDRAIGIKKAPGPLYGVSKDVWSALALAIYAYDTHKGKLGPANQPDSSGLAVVDLCI